MAEEKKDKKKQSKPAGGPGGKQARKPKGGAAPEAHASAADDQPQQPAPPARLAGTYREQISPALMQRFGYKNLMQVPRLEKIIISMGLGKAVTAGEKAKMEQA